MIFAEGFDLVMLMLSCWIVGVAVGIGWTYEKYLLKKGVFKNGEKKDF